MLEELEDIIVPIALCVGLPVSILYLGVKAKMHAHLVRKELILASLERNPNMDAEKLLKGLNPQKSVKERLLGYLFCGSLCSIIGLGQLILALCTWSHEQWQNINGLNGFFSTGALFLGVGIPFLIYYFVGRNLLREEIEKETNEHM